MLKTLGDQHGEVKEVMAQNGFLEAVTPIRTLKNTKELAKCLRQKVQPVERYRSKEGDSSRGQMEETRLGSNAGFCHPCPCAKSLILAPHLITERRLHVGLLAAL